MFISRKFWLFLAFIMICAGLYNANAQTTEGYAFQRAIEEYRNDNLESAIDWFNKELKEHPKNGYAFLYLATLYNESQEYGKALTHINNAISNLPKKEKEIYAAAYGYKGDIMLSLRDTIEAVTNYGRRAS